MCLFKNHRQTFSWPGERPSAHLRITKMWLGPNIKYLSEHFYADFCCREGILLLKVEILFVTNKNQPAKSCSRCQASNGHCSLISTALLDIRIDMSAALWQATLNVILIGNINISVFLFSKITMTSFEI